MAADYTRLAKKMNEAADGIPIAQVDATVETELAERYRIKGYPNLKLFIEGEAIDYKGAREEEKMDAWLKEKTKSVIKQIDNLEQFKEIEGERLAVLLVTSEENDEQLRIFGAIAHNYDSIPFYYSFAEEIRNHFNTGSDFSLIMIRSFDDGQKILNNP